jgi:hypothetical protein
LKAAELREREHARETHGWAHLLQTHEQTQQVASSLGLRHPGLHE